MFTHIDLKSVLRFAALIAITHVLAACSLDPVSPSGLKKLDSSQDLVLDTPIDFKYAYGLGVQGQATLAPGVYRGAGTDGKGVWYVAVEKSMKVVLLSSGMTTIPKTRIGVPSFVYGVLFVPFDETQQPIIFSTTGEAETVVPQNPSAGNEVLVNSALNAQKNTPALQGSSPMTSGLATGVAGGVVAGLIALTYTDYTGKFAVFVKQPPAGTELRKQFHITAEHAASGTGPLQP